MCTKCGNKDCLVGERCGNLESTSMLIEDGTMSAFHLNPFDTNKFFCCHLVNIL